MIPASLLHSDKLVVVVVDDDVYLDRGDLQKYQSSRYTVMT